ncbi:hypothetical protein QTL97_08860 [Sporosarcina thermotolerans]|uniref:ABC transporter permease n=1 Tax=Sporosarcina thermotolerans TaxID=633404 RepID=A0AAW9ABL6_9BACL|nr:hypothetical protein [Sporosarcina thermotolerans]MDW0117043.1 hypothetical protein [Sporosarcina thermotolerans]WHT47857.1 hypothetical protein QNH10_17470 [Sporosarcina thermotolerans]
MSYCLILLPNEETKETYYPEEVRDYLITLEVEQKFREEKGNTGIVLRSGEFVYANNAYYYMLNNAMLNAYEEMDYTRFLYLRNYTLLGNVWEYTADPNLFSLSPFPGKDRAHLYQQTMMRYEDYFKNNYPITYGLIYEKTGLQALQKFLQTNGILFILFCAIYFSSDILSRDRKYRTVLQGMPLSWYRQLNLKSLSTFLYSLLIVAAVLVAGVVVMGLQFGFGYFDLEVPIMIAQQLFTAKDYDVISIATFVAKTLIGVPLLIFLFIRLNVVLGLIVKNEWVVLLISTLILFSDRLFATRTTRELFGVDISFFPHIYFDFGKIVDGEKNFLLNVETITFTKGLVVLLATIAVIEILLFICSKAINKRRFYQT